MQLNSSQNLNKEEFITEQMHNTLELISIPFLIKIIFHPFIELQKEFHAILSDKHIEKSIFRILVIASFSFIGLIIFNWNYPTKAFLFKLVEIFNLPPILSMLTNKLLAVLFFSHCGSYVSQVISKAICTIFYKDPEFYITKRKLNSIEQKFKIQGYNNLNQTEILEIIDFCKINLRKQSSTNLLGDKPADWERSLEAIIYYADLEPFLDQQQSLNNKLLELQGINRALNNYSNTYSTNALQSLNKSHYNSKKLSTNIASFPNSNSCCFWDANIMEKIAKTELRKFKLNNLNQVKASPLTEELLIDNYESTLQDRNAATSSNICSDEATNNLSFNLSFSKMLVPNYNLSINYQPTDSSTEIKKELLNKEKKVNIPPIKLKESSSTTIRKTTPRLWLCLP